MHAWEWDLYIPMVDGHSQTHCIVYIMHHLSSFTSHFDIPRHQNVHLATDFIYCMYLPFLSKSIWIISLVIWSFHLINFSHTLLSAVARYDTDRGCGARTSQCMVMLVVRHLVHAWACPGCFALATPLPPYIGIDNHYDHWSSIGTNSCLPWGYIIMYIYSDALASVVNTCSVIYTERAIEAACDEAQTSWWSIRVCSQAVRNCLGKPRVLPPSKSLSSILGISHCHMHHV